MTVEDILVKYHGVFLRGHVRDGSSPLGVTVLAAAMNLSYAGRGTMTGVSVVGALASTPTLLGKNAQLAGRPPVI